MKSIQQKVKVCCFCERWESGGIEAFLSNVLQHLNLEKFQVDIVSVCLKKSIFTKSLQKLGIRFFELSGNQQKILQNYRLFFELLQHERYDVVHLNIFHGLSLRYAWLAKRAGVVLRIAHSHNVALRKSKTRLIKLIIHKIAKELYTDTATELWACSKVAAEFVFSKKVLKVNGFRFIPNGIDVEHFRYDYEIRRLIRKELQIEDYFVVGNIGRLCYQKNQEFLLDVLVEIKKKQPKSCLLLIGDGDDLDGLKQKAARLRIDGSVIFYGTTLRVEQMLWAMDVFAFPSLFEGLGIAAIEAQAAGLPVVASEYVPKEAICSSAFQAVPLARGAGEWASALLARLNMKTERISSVVAVQRAGFDIKWVAENIEQIWMQSLV